MVKPMQLYDKPFYINFPTLDFDIKIYKIWQLNQGGRSAHELFSGSGFIHKEYITSPEKDLMQFLALYS